MKKRYYLLIFILVIIGLSFLFHSSSNNGNDSQIAYSTYSSQYMSFQYPTGWQIQTNDVGGVNVYNGTQNDNSGWFTVTPYGGKFGANITLNMNDFNNDMANDISGSNPPTVWNGTINGTSYSFIDNPNVDANDGSFSWKYCFFVKNGAGVIVSGYVANIDILKNVIATFN